MTTEWKVGPGGLTRAQATAGMVVAGAFLLFGLVFGAAVVSDLSGGETGLKLALGAFMVVWLVACGSIIFSLSRVRSAAAHAQPGTLFEFHAGAAGGPAGADPVAGLDEGLRRLEALRRDGLLSEAEYQAQRRKLLGA